MIMRLKNQGENFRSAWLWVRRLTEWRERMMTHLEGLNVFSAYDAEQHPWAEITVS